MSEWLVANAYLPLPRWTKIARWKATDDQADQAHSMQSSTI
ncbi:hypothetical protein [Mesorhizobium sp.]